MERVTSMIATTGTDCDVLQPAVSLILELAVLGLAVVFLFRPRSASRFIVDNFIGPWRPGSAETARDEWEGTRLFAYGVARVGLTVFALGAILISVAGLIRTISCL